MATYGGAVNATPPDATASAQRDSILTTSVTAGWQEPGDEETTLVWVRRFYRDLFADTGGVPVPSEASGGASINHPDIDLADPEWNTSGVPWHTMYYRGNYPRLQQVKARWDPSRSSTTPCPYARCGQGLPAPGADRTPGLPAARHRRRTLNRAPVNS